MAFEMAVRAVLLEHSAGMVDGRACFGVASALKMAAQACPVGETVSRMPNASEWPVHEL